MSRPGRVPQALLIAAPCLLPLLAAAPAPPSRCRSAAGSARASSRATRSWATTRTGRTSGLASSVAFGPRVGLPLLPWLVPEVELAFSPAETVTRTVVDKPVRVYWLDPRIHVRFELMPRAAPAAVRARRRQHADRDLDAEQHVRVVGHRQRLLRWRRPLRFAQGASRCGSTRGSRSCPRSRASSPPRWTSASASSSPSAAAAARGPPASARSPARRGGGRRRRGRRPRRQGRLPDPPRGRRRLRGSGRLPRHRPTTSTACSTSPTSARASARRTTGSRTTTAAPTRCRPRSTP